MPFFDTMDNSFIPRKGSAFREDASFAKSIWSWNIMWGNCRIMGETWAVVFKNHRLNGVRIQDDPMVLHRLENNEEQQ